MSNSDVSNVITAMECHRINACHRCPYEGLSNCIERLCDDAVSLVKKLGEENENLKLENAGMEAGIKAGIKVLRANTVREMQAEIINRCVKGGIYPAFVASTIDRIVKEMIDNERPANG